MHYQQKGRNYHAPDNYQDLDGNMKTFTTINHDPKNTSYPTVETPKKGVSIEKEEKSEVYLLCEEIAKGDQSQQFIESVDALLKENEIVRYRIGEELTIDHLYNDYLPNEYYLKLKELWTINQNLEEKS